jgi:hypothetical protein
VRSRRPRFYVAPYDNDDTLTDNAGNPPPRDRTWDVVDRDTNAVVYANCYTRREARVEADRLNQEKP